MTLPPYCRTGVALAFLATATAWGCQIPVFRYALERWEPSPYLLRTPGGAGINLPDPAAANIEIEQVPGLGGFELHYPQKLREALGRSVWTAPATGENLRLILDSPVRAELRQRLLSGQSAIWLLLESGDEAKDRTAFAALTQAIENAAATLKLPDGVLTQEQAADPAIAHKHENADVLQTDLPLRIEFSILSLKRNDPAESALIAMLLHLEPDLGDFAGEPMAFPVFGRGRVLEPLIGRGIHEDNVLEHSRYLCGACSCEIKDLNPGIDLLLTANWDPVDTAPVIETVSITPAATASSMPLLNLAYVLIAAVLLVLAVVLLRRKGG